MQRERYAADPERARQMAKRYRSQGGRGRIAAQTRRALMLAAWVEDVDPVVLFERDNWTCQHCGIACPKDAVWPARDFASHDHIVPLSWGIFRGGFHSYANSQTLCLGCNNKKLNLEAV
jgi:5-methylcytosine-specific restriction endonuclease McrA